MSRRAIMRGLAPLLCMWLPVVTGCDGCAKTSGPVDAAVVQQAPVPAPEGLIAKLVVPAPLHTLTALRAAAGGPSLLLPRSVGGLVANFLGLPLQAAEHFDDNLPVVAAATTDGAGTHLAAAFHIRNTARVIAASTKGSDAKFTSEKQGDIFYLVPTGKSIRRPRFLATLAIVDNYLVAADSREGVLALGYYLTRTLAREELSGADLVMDLEREAIAESSRVVLRWLRSVTADSATSPAWPAHLRAVVDVPGMLTALSDIAAKLGGGRVSLTLNDTALVMEADLGAEAEAFVAPAVSEPARLQELPDDVLIAASWSESQQQREAAAKQRAPAIKSALKDRLGEGWKPADSAMLQAALGQLASGRGDATTMGLRCTGMGLTGLARGSVSDRAGLDEALVTIIGLRKHSAVAKQLERAGITLGAKRTRILEVPGELWRVRLRPKAKSAADITEETDLLAAVRDDDFLLAAGMETVDTLQLLHKPDDERSLFTNKAIVAALGRLRTGVGDRLWLTLLFDPQAAQACAMGKPGGASSAPIVFGVGPKEDRIAVRLEIARALLRVAFKELGAP